MSFQQRQTLDADDIKDTPSSNGNLTDYLKDNPNVRFAGGDLDGLQGGEIKPSSISINGADPEQTAYLINGININNDIDPTGGLFDGSLWRLIRIRVLSKPTILTLIF